MNFLLSNKLFPTTGHQLPAVTELFEPQKTQRTQGRKIKSLRLCGSNRPETEGCIAGGRRLGAGSDLYVLALWRTYGFGR